MSDTYLVHHGIKGMRWGVRRFEDESGHLTPAGKRRYAVQDARKYYKINRLQRRQEKTDDPIAKKRLMKRIRKTQTRSDRKHSDLSRADINAGREIVAKNRLKWAAFNTAAKSALTAAGAAYLYQNPKTRDLAPVALAGGAALTVGSAKKVPYYFMENRRYKQVNPKGTTKKGLTKKQQTLRKIGKTALGVGATAAAVGGTAYLLNKANQARKIQNGTSSATQAMVRANRQASGKRTRDAVRDRVASGARTVASGVGRRVRNAANLARKAGKQAVKNAVINRVKRNIDPDDPRTYVSAARDVVNVGRTVKNGGAPAAAGLVANEAIETTRDNIRRRLKKRKRKD